MEVKIKKFMDEAIIPGYAKEGDAGMDLTAVSMTFDDEGNICYGTGLGFEIPEGYVGLVFPRSSIFKILLYLTNGVGVVDSGYRGEVSLKFKPTFILRWMWRIFKKRIYQVGDRVGQIIIMPYPHIEYVEVTEMSKTSRGTNGYGSTGIRNDKSRETGV